jgi:outer membrane immunogenic protein
LEVALKRSFIACAALAVTLLPISATDVRAQPAGSVPSWAGFYLGVNAGWGWGDNISRPAGNDDASRIFMASILPPPPPVAFDVDGGAAGLQFGYNWQFAGRWVLGAEMDAQLSNIKGLGVSVGTFGTSQTLSYSDHLTAFGTLRARVGYLVADHLLLYATGGFAFGEVRQSASWRNSDTLIFVPIMPDFSCPRNASCFFGGNTSWQAGWTVGGGGELRLLSNLSLKLEYLYANFGKRDDYLMRAVLPNDPNAVSSITVSGEGLEYHFVRAGLNWHF